MNGLKSLISFGAIILLALLMYSCSDSTTGPACCMPPPGTGTYSHTDGTGHSANDFLADSNFTVLSIEIDYMEGYKPTEESLDKLYDFLNTRLNKDEIIINDPTSIPGEKLGPYTLKQVKDLEEKHRDYYTTGDTLTAYMLILDGKYESESVLGIAYYNTSTAYFGETINNYSGGTYPPQWKLEGTVMQHEFGHLFGLVDIPGSGTDMQEDHKDPNSDHGNHCDNDQCLMYWAVQTTDIVSNLFDSSIPELDANCIADLQANGGK